MKRSIRDYATALYEAVTEQPKERKAVVGRFLSELQSDNNRRLLPLIVEELDRIEAEQHNRILVTVTAAEPLTDSQRRNLQKMLKDQLVKEIELTEVVDPELIGGLQIKIGDKLIDHSIKTKLTRLAAQF